MTECAKCGKPATDKHHTYGRRYHDETIDLCRKCHRWVHDNPKEAKKQGFMKSKYKAPYTKKGKGKRPKKTYNVFS